MFKKSTEGIGSKAAIGPKIIAHSDLKIAHFLNFKQGRQSIHTVVPLPMSDLEHDIVLGFTMSLSGMEDVFGSIQDEWYQPQKLAQKLDLCFDRFRRSADYFKSFANQADRKVSMQKAVVFATFQDIMNESLAFHETTVKVSIVEATGLLAMDSNGFSDPYCEVILRYLNSGQSCGYDKTPIIKTSLNPRWDWSREYTLKSAMVVEIRVFDHDVGMNDDFLGCACVDLSDIRKQAAGVIKEMWLPLCDEPSQDSKHKALRLLGLTPNSARGQVITKI